LAASDRAVKPVSHKAVQQFKGKIELLGFSQRGLRILRVLGTPDCTASDAAKVVGCSKSLVSHWKNHAIKTGCLRLLADGIVKYYELTPLGKKILERSKNLTTGEAGFGCVHVLEDHAVKFEILKEEDAERRIDWKKLGEPRNWVKWGFKLGNVRVVKTSRSIIIHPGKLRDFDADALLVTAGQIVGRVRLELMVRFGMVLSEEGVALHAPVWEVFTAEAKELENAGTFKVHMRGGAVGGLDNSPPDRQRHFEYNRKELAVAAVRSPELFVELAQKVDVLIQTVSGLVAVNERLVGLLSEAFDLAKGSDAGKEAVKFGDGGKSYVR
jgi:DNA-binding MarR family transcriptional regulator